MANEGNAGPVASIPLTMTRARFRSRVEALSALAWLRVPLACSGLEWWMLGGVGRSDHGFGARPDPRALAVLASGPLPPVVGRYLARRATVDSWHLEPIRAHGAWRTLEVGTVAGRHDGQQRSRPEVVAAVTHAALPLRVLVRFWRRVPEVAEQAVSSLGFVDGFGFGTVPLVGLATFSVWEDEDSMRRFAWSAGAHADVVATTRSERWFRREFFGVFRVVTDPVTGPGPA